MLSGKAVSLIGQLIDLLIKDPDGSDYKKMVELASLPEMIRGYDVVKENNIELMIEKRSAILSTVNL